MQNEINLQEFKKILNYLIDNNRKLVDEGKRTIAIGCEGEAGTGKTSIMEQIAEERGMTFIKLNLAELEESGDLVGFPLKEFKINELDENGNVVCSKWVAHDLLSTYFQKPCKTYEITNESRMSYATPAWLPREENPNGVLLVLDDYSRASSILVQATNELICRGTYVSWNLPKYTTIALTTNPDNGEYQVTTMDEAQKTRFINFPIRFDLSVWSSWAEFAGLDSRGINFLLSYPEVLESKDGVNKANSRSYTMFINAISGIDDWSAPENLALILNISKGCFSFDKGNIIGGLFTTFIANKLDKLVSPKDMLLQSWDTVKGKIKRCVYDDGEYRPEIASVLATRLLNYSMVYFGTKGCKSSVVQDRLLDIINSEDKLFSEDLIFNIVKNLATKYSAKMNKVLMIPAIRAKLL